MALNRKARLQERRSFLTGLVRRILQRVVNGDLDAHEGYAQVRKMYLDESDALEDLKALVEPAEIRSKEDMIAAAREWLERA